MKTVTDSVQREARISCWGRRVAFPLALLAFLVFAPFVALAQDADGDGYPDWADNCPGVQNSSLLDADADRLGDDCDDTPFGDPSPVGAINGMDLGFPGPRSCQIFTLGWNGDTLPVGPNLWWVPGIFDTGSANLVLNADTRLALGIEPFNVNGIPPDGPFDVRLWGPAVVPETSESAPLYWPEAQVPDVQASSTFFVGDNLVGGPVTNQVMAYIDYRIRLDRFGVTCAAITFYPPDTSGIDPFPTPLFFADLHAFGDIAATRGQRYKVTDMRLVNDDRVAESSTEEFRADLPADHFRFVYDTGNTDTQISTEVAEALGIDVDHDPPAATDRVHAANHACDDDQGWRPLNGYRISRLEIDAADGSHAYIVENPLVFVPTHCPDDLSPDTPFGGAADGNLGTDLFAAVQVLFDGPGSRLGLYTGVVVNQPPVCDAGGDYTAECSEAVTLDGSGSSDPDENDVLDFLWEGSFDGGGQKAGEVVTVTYGNPGTDTVRLTVSDGQAEAECSAGVTIVDTKPPTISAPANVTAECASPLGTGVPDLGSPEVLDRCDESVAVENDSPGTFPLGDTSVKWTATDDSGNSASAVQVVTVEDTTPPTLTVPPDVTAECTSPGGTPVDIGSASASDSCDATVDVVNNAADPFPLGEHHVTWTATDDSGNSASGAQVVTVVDTTPPVLRLSVSPGVLWPPDHKMVSISVTTVVEDICDAAPEVELVSITSTEGDETNTFDPEYDSTLGDGHTDDDIQVDGEGMISLRSERSGGGSGRVYTITYRATDASGNSTTQSVDVTVPHDMQ